MSDELHNEISSDRFALARTTSGYMLTYSEDQIIGKSLRTSGRFAERDIDAARDLLTGAGVNVKTSIFLDVGANIGTHSVHALKSGFERAVCIEPDPHNFKLLRINQILNDVDARCVNFMAAASASERSAVLEASPTNFGDHRVRIQADGGLNLHDEQEWKLRNITTRHLEAMIAEAGSGVAEIGLAWIDTQGHEGHVLAGAPGLLASGVPIVLEFWPYGLTRSAGWSLLRGLLGPSGRKIHDLRRSIEARQLAAISIDELDAAFAKYLAAESKSFSPYLDLLLL
jgi:FkbM family methyltransferase